MRRYEHKLAYRHANGQVEGFVGDGSTRAKAIRDGIEQIKRKLEIIAYDLGGEAPAFDKSRVINSPSTLSKEEVAIVQRDWNSALRYR